MAGTDGVDAGEHRARFAGRIPVLVVLGICLSGCTPTAVVPVTPQASTALASDHASTPASTANVAPTETAPVSSPASVGSWRATTSMAVARKRHTATLLPDGRVLVAGGVDSNDDSTTKALASAELYDPRTGTWTTTGKMAHPRSWHTATLLPSGLVLVAGGQCPGPATKGCPAIGDPSGAIAESELYDPKTGRWTATGSMTSPRFEHTATLLADGKVLVAGAELAPDAILASTELYDPATGRWTSVGNMQTARWQQFSVGLPDGTALVAGGYGDVSPTAHGLLNSVELFNPKSGSWVSVPPLLTGRAQGGASVLLADGRILIAAGDGGGDNMLASAELYAPTRGSVATGSMSTTRAECASALLSDGRLMVVGGFDVPGTGKLLSSAEIYDPGSGTWSGAGEMTAARFEFKATLLADGRVLVTGGSAVPAAANVSGADTVSASADVYSP